MSESLKLEDMEVNKQKRRFSVNDISNPVFQEPFKYGWVRELVYRFTVSQSSNMADVYYYTPEGKRLRSKAEIIEHLPKTGELKIDNFSFTKKPILDDPTKELIRHAKPRNSLCKASRKVAVNKITSAKTKRISTNPAYTTKSSKMPPAVKDHLYGHISGLSLFDAARWKIPYATEYFRQYERIRAGTQSSMDTVPPLSSSKGICYWPPGIENRKYSCVVVLTDICRVSAKTDSTTSSTSPTLSPPRKRGRPSGSKNRSPAHIESRESRKLLKKADTQKNLNDKFSVPPLRRKRGRPQNRKNRTSAVYMTNHKSRISHEDAKTDSTTNSTSPTLSPPRKRGRPSGSKNRSPAHIESRESRKLLKKADTQKNLNDKFSVPPLRRKRGRPQNRKNRTSAVYMTNHKSRISHEDAETYSTTDSAYPILSPPRKRGRSSGSINRSPAHIESRASRKLLENDIIRSALCRVAVVNLENCRIPVERNTANGIKLSNESRPNTPIGEKYRTDSYERAHEPTASGSGSPHSQMDNCTSLKSEDHKSDSDNTVNEMPPLIPRRPFTVYTSFIHSHTDKLNSRTSAVSDSDDEMCEPTILQVPSHCDSITQNTGLNFSLNDDMNSPTPLAISPSKKYFSPAERLTEEFLGTGCSALLQIFRYLTLAELLLVHRVSKLWNFVGSHRSLWKTVRMKNSRVVDWNGFRRALLNHGTECLDLNDMLVPESSEEEENMWDSFLRVLPDIRTLVKIDLGRCSTSTLALIPSKATQLESIVCLGIKGNDGVDLDKFRICTKLKELKLRTLKGILLLKNLSCPKLFNLNALALRNVQDLTGIESYLPEGLVSLELGHCNHLPLDFARNTLCKLTKLRKLRLESVFVSRLILALLEAVASLKELNDLELINWDVPNGFDKALGKCLNINKLMLIPTYRDKAATTRLLVLGLGNLKSTLTDLIWGLTTELLDYTDTLFDEWAVRYEALYCHKPTPGEYIPLKCLVGTGRHEGTLSKVYETHLLSFKCLKELMVGILPRTSIRVVKMPYASTWDENASFYP